MIHVRHHRHTHKHTAETAIDKIIKIDQNRNAPVEVMTNLKLFHFLFENGQKANKGSQVKREGQVDVTARLTNVKQA